MPCFNVNCPYCLILLQVRAINRKLVEAEANEDGAAVRDDQLSSLETKLLNTGSELVGYLN